jgi:proteasome lid subunit RPN8/RPN11
LLWIRARVKILRAALLKLEEQNKASLNVDSWFSAYHHSHPHLVERLSAIDVALKRAVESSLAVRDGIFTVEGSLVVLGDCGVCQNHLGSCWRRLGRKCE